MKKLFSAIIIACTLSIGVSAQVILPSATPEADSIAFARVRARMDSIRQYRPTVGLVLAGGGARGLAHLGVIKYMEELGIPVDLITGTSMGGLVGGLYSLGYSHDQLDSLVRDIQWPVMMSDKIPDSFISYRLRKYRERFVIRIPFHYDDEDLAERLKQERVIDRMAEEAGNNSTDMMQEALNKIGIGMPDGFLYGLNVRNTLSSVSVGYQDSLDFVDLPIPYVCVATDLYKMAPKYWTSGSVTAAMRSTMAIPFYFRAVRGGGEILLDGGMRNNFPVDIAREMGADIIIGSDMSIHRGIDELNSPVDFVFQTITLLSSEALAPAMDILGEGDNLNVHHELEGYNMLSFDDESVDDIINQGYQNAIAQKELFENIAARVAGRPAPNVVRHKTAVNLAQSKVRVSEVKITGIREDEQRILLHPSDYPADGIYDRDIIERMLNAIYGTNAFESVTYHLEGHEEPYTLVFDCQKGQVNDFALGLRADTDETVALALHVGLGTRRLGGPRFTADIKLGINPAATFDWAVKSKKGIPTFGVDAHSRYINTISGYANSGRQTILTMGTNVYLEDSRMRHGSMRVGVSADWDPYEHYLSYMEENMGWNWKNHTVSAFAHFNADTFNDGYFPTKGVRLSLKGRLVFDGYAEKLDPDAYYWREEWEPTTEGGKYPLYLTSMGSFEGAFSFGSRFTVLPKLYVGYYNAFGVDNGEYLPRDYMNIKHIVTVGGFMQDRYSENQIPFFLWPNGYRKAITFSSLAQMDLRYCFLRKNFATVRTGVYNDAYDSFSFSDPIWAFGAEYSRQTMVGPLRLAVQWGNIFGLSAYASIGFEF